MCRKTQMLFDKVSAIGAHSRVRRWRGVGPSSRSNAVVAPPNTQLAS